MPENLTNQSRFRNPKAYARATQTFPTNHRFRPETKHLFPQELPRMPENLANQSLFRNRRLESGESRTATVAQNGVKRVE
ncbi:hypothetical protein CEXT_664721 [Caerostris extrusa]|uniref:Uncharacterized protein n=1 Tax=Caerostris extrusa TaxID=172846 RepID=A0AAV4TSN0_CAEEX|nr:hypothetical protein CEXT_664721 [Caerostris extrusa]